MIIDAHAHIWYPPSFSLEEFLKWAARLGIDRLCVSKLPSLRPSSISSFSKANRDVAEAMKAHPEAILGYCYVNPAYGERAVEEFRRCLEEYGMLGLKLYTDCHCLDPRVSPLIELAVGFNAPILIHTAHMQRRYIEEALPFHRNPPTVSNSEEVAELARRHPKATIIMAHIGGGGDWEWAVKAARNASNLMVDTSGSGVDLGMIELAVREVGAERVVFGTDNCLSSGIGKIRGAELSERDRRLILGENMLRIIERRGLP
ncbi:MAG: metal-dependent hydrolase [Candidatus Bathyarchaeota archaeon B26-2]|nr:MAG: metal-dependent hydrolase [Candidatus Bathyarchaeota archaeon B26-2]